MSLGLAEVIMSKNCILDWKISMFLVDCGKSVIRRSQVRIVFQLFLTIIEERGLAALDSQDIILSDMQMEKLTGMPHLHLYQLRDCVMSLLTISETGRRVLNPTDSYKIMIHRIFPQYLPPRDDTESAAPPVQAVSPLQSQIKWIMEEDLSTLLIGFVSTQPVEFNFILTLLTSYISTNRARLLHPKNLAVACIRLDGLYNIFRVSYIHNSQLRGYLRDHVNPVAVD